LSRLKLAVDGIGFDKEAATGTLFFYLSVEDMTGEQDTWRVRDPTKIASSTLTALPDAAVDLEANPNATVALSKAQGGRDACYMDAEDPTCWRLSLTGKVSPVEEGQKSYAESVVFSK
jgi:hypothetical protein